MIFICVCPSSHSNLNTSVSACLHDLSFSNYRPTPFALSFACLTSLQLLFQFSSFILRPSSIIYRPSFLVPRFSPAVRRPSDLDSRCWFLVYQRIFVSRISSCQPPRAPRLRHLSRGARSSSPVARDFFCVLFIYLFSFRYIFLRGAFSETSLKYPRAIANKLRLSVFVRAFWKSASHPLPALCRVA